MRVTHTVASLLVAFVTANPYGPPPPRGEKGPYGGPPASVPPYSNGPRDSPYSAGPRDPPVPHRGYGPPPVFHPPPKYPKKPTKSCSQEPCCLENHTTPIFNSLLFDECPLHKNDETVCAMAAKKFAEYGTTLAVKKDYHPENVELNPRQGYELDNVRTYSKATDGSHDRKYNTVVHPAVVNGKWYSDTDADLVAIRRGCCFNIYGDVHVGDKLDTECENEVLGDPDQLYTLPKYSVITPGSLRTNCRTGNRRRMLGAAERRLEEGDYCTMVNPVIVGGDLNMPPQWFIDITANPVGQFWNGISLQVGSNISPGGTGGISVGSGADQGVFEQLETGKGGSRVTNDIPILISEADVEESRLVAQKRICAFSDQLKSQEETEDCQVINGVLTVKCTDATAQNCVANCSKEDVESAIDIDIVSPGSQVIINVDGENIDMNLEGYNRSDGVSVIWNFHKAQTVDIEAYEFKGSIVTPRAMSVRLRLRDEQLQGSVLNGALESLTEISVPAVSIDVGGYPDPSPLKPVKPEVTLCTCLCEQEKCY